MRRIARASIHLSLAAGCAAFSAPQRGRPPTLPAAPSNDERIHGVHRRQDDTSIIATCLTSLAILTAPLVAVVPNAHADTWGKETEAPTLFTGETTMICKKRGPLGACLETVVRTQENDNDKALKYFKDPSAEVKKRQERALIQAADDSEGNALIQKLRQQSLDNKERNDDMVRAKTLMNDSGASFGPFGGQVVILNTDGKTFTLLNNPQAMRLKKAGYIEDRKFVVQPSEQVIDDALEGKNDLLDGIKGIFGSKAGEEEAEPALATTSQETASAEPDKDGEIISAESKVDDALPVSEST